MIKVAIDAGHGINTPGKRIPKTLDSNNTREWTLNNRIVTNVVNQLKPHKDIKVLRLDDPTGRRDVPLRERTTKANNFGADILISVHHNAWKGIHSGSGITVYTHTRASQKSKEYQKKIYDQLIKHTGLKGNRATPLPQANFHMTRESKMPAVLIENGFMDSRVDAPIILSKSHSDKSANAIVEFILTEFNVTRPSKPQPKPSEPVTSTNSIVDYLNSKGINSSYSNRKKLATQYGISNYRGTANQNLELLRIMGNEKVDIEQLANDVIAGKYGVGAERKRRLGEHYSAVQKRVNEILKPKSLKVGNKVKLKSSARRYATGEVIPNRIKNRTYTIQQIKGSRVLLKEIYSWVLTKDVE